MVNDTSHLVIIDAMGKPCPMPLLMLKRALKSTDDKQFLLKSSDPHSQQDITRYCNIHSIICDVKTISNNEFHYIIKV